MVEEAILLHPAVADVAVCGLPDTHRGEVVKAYVQLRPDQKLKAVELRSFLQDKLASFAIPRRVSFRKDLPKTLIGKPDKRSLMAADLAKQAKRKAQKAEAETQA